MSVAYEVARGPEGLRSALPRSTYGVMNHEPREPQTDPCGDMFCGLFIFPRSGFFCVFFFLCFIKRFEVHIRHGQMCFLLRGTDQTCQFKSATSPAGCQQVALRTLWARTSSFALELCIFSEPRNSERCALPTRCTRSCDRVASTELRQWLPLPLVT